MISIRQTKMWTLMDNVSIYLRIRISYLIFGAYYFAFFLILLQYISIPISIDYLYIHIKLHHIEQIQITMQSKLITVRINLNKVVMRKLNLVVMIVVCQIVIVTIVQFSMREITTKLR